MITIEIIMESYNPVLHKVLGGHRKRGTSIAPTHIGSSSKPLTFLGDSNRVFRHLGGMPLSGYGAPNISIVDIIPDYS